MNKKKLTEHQRMILEMCRNPDILKKALGHPNLWIRSTEYVINKNTQEKADMIFQNQWDAYCVNSGTICYVLELKSNKGDHEILGQLEKAIEVMDKIGRATKHWEDVRGIAIAKEYTLSGRDLLNKAGHRTFLWCENPRDGIRLREIGCVKKKKKRIVRKAIKSLKKDRRTDERS